MDSYSLWLFLRTLLHTNRLDFRLTENLAMNCLTSESLRPSESLGKSYLFSDIIISRMK